MSLVLSIPDHSDKMEGHTEDLSHTLKGGKYLEEKNSVSACVARSTIHFSLDANLQTKGCSSDISIHQDFGSCPRQDLRS